jgi:N-ethylmaleimide reductase
MWTCDDQLRRPTTPHVRRHFNQDQQTMSLDFSTLFTPYRLGDLELPNRIVMAPLTRNRADQDTDAANAMMAEHYRQRASAGLIITEGSQISRQGQGYIRTPGIHSDVQVEGWRKVTDAVHNEGGHVFVQLWHVGRVSHVSLQPGGAAPVGPSAIRANTRTYVDSGFIEVSEPRALSLDEIAAVVEDYRKACANAKRAGFDGVEIHAANGYLLDQFQKDGSNKRTDAYGGSVENRARLTLQVVDAALSVWDKSRVGIRLAPVTPSNDVSDSNPAAIFGHIVSELDRRRIGYIHVVEGETGGDRDFAPFNYRNLRKAFRGAYIANNGYTRELAAQTLLAGDADLIAFGKSFIGNPDLVLRLRLGAPLAEPDPATFFGGGVHGYNDYSILAL